MWFTRVSIANPVMAVMVMLAFVVLGLFSYQRLSLDQFPNIDFPTVVVSMDYPGASPEIVEAEVTNAAREQGADRLTFPLDRSGRFTAVPRVEPVVPETKYC